MRIKWFPQEGSLGDQLEMSFFAILPIHVGSEIRWLERVTVLYIYTFDSIVNPTDNIAFYGRWKPVKFKENETLR